MLKIVSTDVIIHGSLVSATVTALLQLFFDINFIIQSSTHFSYLFLSIPEREQVIAQTIKEVKEEFRAKEEARKNRIQTQNEKEGKYTSSQMLTRFFKRPSKQALKLGLAQLMYEEMVRKTDRKLSEIKRKKKMSAQAKAVSPMAKAEALADEPFHKTGSLHSPEEVGRLWDESE